MPGDDLRIVPAPRALKPRIEELTRATFEEHRARQPFAFPENAFEMLVQPNIDAAFANDHGKLEQSPNMWAAFRGDDLAGYILFSRWAREDPVGAPYVSIDDICVVPEHRGQGVARALLRHAKSLCDTHGWDNLRASVWVGNAASEAAFRAEGFTPEMTSFRYGPDGPARNYPKPSPRGKPGWVLSLIAAAVAGSVIVLILLLR